MCDKDIFVYTKELEYVRQIKDPVHFSDIYDISPDEHGNLYVLIVGTLVSISSVMVVNTFAHLGVMGVV